MPIARFQMPDGRIGRFEVPEGTTPEQAQQLISEHLGQQQSATRDPNQVDPVTGKTRAQLEQELVAANEQFSKGNPISFKVANYARNYFGGMKKAGSDFLNTVKDSPVTSVASAIPGALEVIPGVVGNVIGDAGAVVHSAFDKIPGSSYLGDFDPNKTFAQRRAEYQSGLGSITAPQTNMGKRFSETLGATLKPIGDGFGLAGKATGRTASFMGASPEDAKSVEDQTNALVNVGLLAKSMRKTPEPKKVEPVPSKQELKQSAQDAYKRAEEAGAVVTQESFGKVLGDIQNKLNDEGLNSKLTPASSAAIEHIAKHKGPLTIKQLETYRKVAKNAESSSITNPADARLASKIVESIDNYMESLTGKDLKAGDAAAATSALKEARGLWARYRKTDLIDETMSRAELRAQQFSGSGLENAIRTEFRQLAMNKKKMRGFSAEEQAAIKKISAGGPIENSLRMIGKAAPTSIVSGALGGGIGLAAGGPVGAVVVPAVGGLSRLGAKKMAINNVNSANALMRAGPGYTPPAPGPFLPFNLNPAFPIGSTLAEIESNRNALLKQRANELSQ